MYIYVCVCVCVCVVRQQFLLVHVRLNNELDVTVLHFKSRTLSITKEYYQEIWNIKKRSKGM